MLYLSLGLFGIAAIIGLTLARALFRKQETSKPVAVMHGLAGASGLLVLILFSMRSPREPLTIAIGLLVIAAIGGFILFGNDIRRKPGPLFLVVVHAAAAVVAVGLVAWVALN